MAKKQITGAKLRITESAVEFNFKLQDINKDIEVCNKKLQELKLQKKEVQTMRNNEIKHALKMGASYKQVGDRLGMSKVAIFYIKQEDNNDNE